jgi:hypothetical protein
MKQFLNILILFAFLVQLSGKVFIYASFQYNKDYISSTLCENIAIPEMECEGKCFLKKELEKEERQSSKQNNNLKDKTETYFCEGANIVSFQSYLMPKMPSVSNIPNLPKGFSEAIYHPPLS